MGDAVSNSQDRLKLQDALRIQLRFLTSSCEIFDQGHREEGIRIAQCLRVIFHQTRNSDSLIHQLGMQGLLLLSSFDDFEDQIKDPEKYIQTVGGNLVQFTISAGGGARIIPPLDDSERHFIPYANWWEQAFWVIPRIGPVRRRDLILAAANKDGGAHVDLETRPDHYNILSGEDGGGRYTQKVRGEIFEAGIGEVHLVALRQMGYEILHSPSMFPFL